MDTLKNKQFKNYDYTCRYSSVPYYYNVNDKKYIYGIGTQMKQNNTYVAHKVQDSDTLENLALKYYGNPTLFWVIGYFNNIVDAYEPLQNRFSVIKIPDITGIAFGEER